MPLVILIVIVIVGVYVADAVSAVFNAVGGWPGVIVIVVGGAVLLGVWGRRQERAAELAELKSTPGRVRALAEDAQKFFGEATEALNEARMQFDEKRAPLFWDKLAECEEALAHCVDRLEGAQELIEKYNDRAPARELTDPAKLAPLPPAAYNDTNALFAEMSDCSYQAIAVAEFAVIYEQRKQGERIAHEQQRMQSKLDALEAKTDDAIAIASDAASTAETAKRIGKSARGDWF